MPSWAELPHICVRSVCVRHMGLKIQKKNPKKEQNFQDIRI